MDDIAQFNIGDLLLFQQKNRIMTDTMLIIRDDDSTITDYFHQCILFAIPIFKPIIGQDIIEMNVPFAQITHQIILSLYDKSINIFSSEGIDVLRYFLCCDYLGIGYREFMENRIMDGIIVEPKYCDVVLRVAHILDYDNYGMKLIHDNLSETLVDNIPRDLLETIHRKSYMSVAIVYYNGNYLFNMDMQEQYSYLSKNSFFPWAGIYVNSPDCSIVAIKSSDHIIIYNRVPLYQKLVIDDVAGTTIRISSNNELVAYHIKDYVVIRSINYNKVIHRISSFGVDNFEFSYDSEYLIIIYDLMNGECIVSKINLAILVQLDIGAIDHGYCHKLYNGGKHLLIFDSEDIYLFDYKTNISCQKITLPNTYLNKICAISSDGSFIAIFFSKKAELSRTYYINVYNRMVELVREFCFVSDQVYENFIFSNINTCLLFNNGYHSKVYDWEKNILDDIDIHHEIVPEIFRYMNEGFPTRLTIAIEKIIF